MNFITGFPVGSAGEKPESRFRFYALLHLRYGKNILPTRTDAIRIKETTTAQVPPRIFVVFLVRGMEPESVSAGHLSRAEVFCERMREEVQLIRCH